MTLKTRSVFHEVRSTVTPGLWFTQAFCCKCEKQKPALGGKRLGPAKLFVCGECVKPKRNTA